MTWCLQVNAVDGGTTEAAKHEAGARCYVAAVVSPMLNKTDSLTQ